MTNRWLIPLLLAFALPAAAQTSDKPTYAQIQAIFSKHCVSCHNAKDEEGELVLESYATLLKGGEDGAAVGGGALGRTAQSAPLSPAEEEKTATAGQGGGRSDNEFLPGWERIGAGTPGRWP